jgi:integrase
MNVAIGSTMQATATHTQTAAPFALPQLSEPANLTVSDVARAWLERARGGRGEWARSTRERYERVVRRHIEASDDPDQRPLGECGLSELTMDDVAAWSAANERVLAPTTAVIALISLKQICRYAVRRGLLAENPVSGLEPGEKPRWTPGRVGILEGDDLAKVLDRSGSHRQLFEFLAYTGLRIGEALGLTWADVDFERNVVRVHRQLSRYRVHARLKTDAARREVLLAPAIVRLLGQRWLESPFKGADDFAFATKTRRGLDYRHVCDAFRIAVRRAGLSGRGRLSLHSLRHGYASLLISKRLDIVFVSRQLGHANANITLSVYAHLFAQREHGEVARHALEASYAAMTEARDVGR